MTDATQAQPAKADFLKLDGFTQGYIEAALWSSTVDNPNQNCLANMRCPESSCLSFGPFKIQITTTVEVDDSGVGDQTGDNEWDETSACQCVECEHSGTVADFTMVDDEPMDRNYSFGHFSAEAQAKCIEDCRKFQEECGELITEENCTHQLVDHTLDQYAGHDFWLTRCGHGCGFWDGDWVEPAASKLDEVSKRFGNVDLGFGDDGEIYLS